MVLVAHMKIQVFRGQSDFAVPTHQISHFKLCMDLVSFVFISIALIGVCLNVLIIVELRIVSRQPLSSLITSYWTVHWIFHGCRFSFCFFYSLILV